MNKKTLQELKLKLEKEKVLIEKLLKNFAKKNKKLSGDWRTYFPEFNGAYLEEAADEVEEYSTLLSIEYSLENRLADINLALEKIRTSLSTRTSKGKHLRKGGYGICEKCKKPISIERLKIYPEARTCNKCK